MPTLGDHGGGVPDGQSQRRRVLGSAVLGIVAGGVTASIVPWQLAMLVGWDTVALLVVVRVWLRVARFTPQQTSDLATSEDDSRTWADLLLVSSSVASLAGAAAGIVSSVAVSLSHATSPVARS